MPKKKPRKKIEPKRRRSIPRLQEGRGRGQELRRQQRRRSEQQARDSRAINDLGRAIGRLLSFLISPPAQGVVVVDVEGVSVTTANVPDGTAPLTKVHELPAPASAACPCGSGKKFRECHGGKT